MDKTEIKCRFRRSVESYEENATVQKLIAERLFQLLEKYSEEVLFRILEVGCGTGLFTRKLKRKCEDSILVINDIVEEMCCKTSAVWFPERNLHLVVSDFLTSGWIRYAIIRICNLLTVLIFCNYRWFLYFSIISIGCFCKTDFSNFFLYLRKLLPFCIQCDIAHV